MTEIVDLEAQKAPLLTPMPLRNPFNNVINKTFKSAGHLANLLPTGSLLGFQFLSPVFTNRGQCNRVNKTMTAGLVILSGLSCFLLNFTDSFRDSAGHVRYGLATAKGLWELDGTGQLTEKEAEKYRIRFADFVHALMSMMVFAAVALFDQNVVSCFYPVPSAETKSVLTSLPIAIGIVCSVMFVVFPTTRHGIGFPLSAQ